MCSKDIKRQSFSLGLLGCVSKLIFAIISSKKQQHVGFQIEDRFPCEIQPYMFPGLMNKENPRQRDIVCWACCLLNPHFQSLPSLNIAWPSPPHIWKLLELSRNQSILIYLYFPAKKGRNMPRIAVQSAHEILMARPELKALVSPCDVQVDQPVVGRIWLCRGKPRWWAHLDTEQIEDLPAIHTP